MPSIYQLKPAFQNLLRPFVQKLFNIGITANQVTLLAMFISLGLSFFSIPVLSESCCKWVVIALSLVDAATNGFQRHRWNACP